MKKFERVEKNNLKSIREKREKLRDHWSTLLNMDDKVDFETSIELRKEEKQVFKKWAFYDGLIKAIDK